MIAAQSSFSESRMAQRLQHPQLEQCDLSGVRVLLADPDEQALECYERYLAECGAAVARATGGVDCITQLQSFRPHVLVLEPELPWGSGSGVISWMLEDSELPTTPVIVVTAGRDLEQLRQILQFPLYDLVVKPLPERQLAKKIRWVADTAPTLGDIGWPRK
jgi:DNA-binding response OmpR family regulator